MDIFGSPVFSSPSIPEIDLEWMQQWLQDNPLTFDNFLDNDSQSSDVSDDSEVFYGSFVSYIVNLQLDINHINSFESVRLQCDGSNLHVYSMDTRIGELPPPIAAIMRDVLDLARVEGTILHPEGISLDLLNVPLKLALYGRTMNKHTVLNILNSAGIQLESSQTPETIDLTLDEIDDLNPSVFNQHSAQTSFNDILPNFDSISNSLPLLSQSAFNSTDPETMEPIIDQLEPMDLSSNLPSDALLNSLETLRRPQPMVESHREQLERDEINSALDKMFDTLNEDDKTTMAEPTEAVASPLYPHQKQALHWMMDRENGSSLPPFWRENESGGFFNTLLNHTVDTCPDSIRGGILADDMGLGKTLQMISLILTNFVDSKPLAVPVPGRQRSSKKPKMAPSPSPDTVTQEVTEKSDNEISGFEKIAAIEEEIKSIENTKASTPNSPSSPTNGRSSPAFSSSLSQSCPSPPGVASCPSSLYSSPITSPSSIHSQACPSPPVSPSSSAGQKVKTLPPKLRFKADKSFVELPQTTASDLEVSQDSNAEEVRIITDTMAVKRHLEETPAKNHCKTQRKAILLDIPPPSKKTKKAKSQVLSKYDEKIRRLSSDFKDLNKSPVDRQHLEIGRVCRTSKQESYTREPEVTIQDCDKESESTSQSVEEPENTSTQTDKISESSSLSFESKSKGCTLLSDKSPDTEIGLKGDNACVTSLYQPQLSPLTEEDSDTDSDLPDIEEMVTTKHEGFDIDAFMSENNCDEDGRTRHDGPRGTLIICPLSVLSNWQGQLEEHVDPSVHIKIHMYYGNEKCKDIDEFKQKDVVITTYGTLLVEYKSYLATGQSLLMNTDWLRVVLDEGHCIRNPNAKQTKAVLALKAQRKWILSGTPIQNRILDLWPLIKFLEITPLNERYWWKCIMEKPLQSGKKIAFKRIQLLMGNIALRRTKNMQVEGKPLVDLPKRLVFNEHIKMSDEESKIYQAMEEDGKSTIKKYVNGNKLLEKYILVLEIMLRLRQMCCHRSLLPEDRLPPDESDDEDNVDEDKKLKKEMLLKRLQVISDSEEECSICVDTLKVPVILPCAHYYCHACILKTIKHKEEKEEGSASCPLCRASLSLEDILELPPEKSAEPQLYGDWHSSTKVDALMSALVKLREEDVTTKSLVVSQFTAFLTLVQTPLKEMGFKFVRLDGKMSSAQRTEVIQKFSETGEDTPTVLLLSLRAGGVGLNLTSASRVFLMEPHWNPATEEQCFDRCHRLGQTKDVIITKFISESTIEERMLVLQDKKRQLMQKSFKKKKTTEQRNRERMREIQDLMMIN